MTGIQALERAAPTKPMQSAHIERRESFTTLSGEPVRAL
jgi:hypothetical protein